MLDLEPSLRILWRYSASSLSSLGSKSVRCTATLSSSAMTSSSLIKTGPTLFFSRQLRREIRGHQSNMRWTSSSINVRIANPTKKCRTKIAASPLRLYQSQMSGGIYLGIGTPSGLTSSDRESSTSCPLADHKMPCVTQNEGIIVKNHLRLSPQCMAIGICCKVNTIAVPRQPALKWMNKVMI